MFKLNTKNIFNQSVRIKNNLLFVGRKKIELDKVVGCEKIDDSVLLNISRGNGYPYAKLTLINGKSLKISSVYNFIINDETVSYAELIKHIEQNSKNISNENHNWLAVRMFIPSGIVQVLATLVGFIQYHNIDKAITFALVASLLVLPLGYYWERRVHKTYIAKTLNKI